MRYDRFIKQVGRNIKEARLKKGLTQFDMMDYGFSRRQYQYIESGNRNVTLKTLFRLAKALGIQPKDFL